MASINPYLNFTGTCEEAFAFYHSVFGGTAPSFMRFSEIPPAEDRENQMSEAEANLIMHVSLPISEETTLMGSDRPSWMGAVTPGDNVQISVGTKGDEETTRIFNGLAEGGHVVMPLDDMFWGAKYGMLVDKFGVQWMVNGEHGSEE